MGRFSGSSVIQVGYFILKHKLRFVRGCQTYASPALGYQELGFSALSAELLPQEEFPFVSAAVVGNILVRSSTCIQKKYLCFWVEQLQRRGVPLLRNRA